MIARHYHIPDEPITRPLRGFQNAPAHRNELRSHRRLHQLNHLYRRMEPLLCAVLFAVLAWFAAPVLWAAIGAI